MSVRTRVGTIASALVLAMMITTTAASGQEIPLPNAHAHNDYEHERPLHDALDHGFCSVEADIWLVDGQLLIGHDEADLTPERTLDALYLKPLHDRVAANGGRVYSDGPELILLIDIKNRPTDTYAALVAALEPYEDMLTTFTADSETLRAVRVVVSGGRPLSQMLAEEKHYAAYDGRIPDLDKEYSANFMPLISASFATAFPNAQSPLDDAVRSEIRKITAAAREKGRKVRFWATPDDESLWSSLLELGVDLINTDDLSRLSNYLLSAGGSAAPGPGDSSEN